MVWNPAEMDRPFRDEGGRGQPGDCGFALELGALMVLLELEIRLDPGEVLRIWAFLKSI
jgi:hypothetical protein